MTPTKIRFWNPTVDVYHCSFRLLRLLEFKSDHSLSVEKLCLLDFYLLYPFLLHRASMPDQTRRLFRELRVQNSTEQFVQIPSEKSLFRDVADFQRIAASNLVAKGLLKKDAFELGTASLEQLNVPAGLRAKIEEVNSEERAFMGFLVNGFGQLEMSGTRGLRALTGVVRRRQ